MNVAINNQSVSLEHTSGRVLSSKHVKLADLSQDGAEKETPSPGEPVPGPTGAGATLTEFWMSCDDGKDQCFTLSARLQLQEGHYISLIKANTQAQGMLVALTNHTTQKTTFIGAPAAALRWLGLSRNNSSLIMALYIVCALLCLALWLLTGGDLMVLVAVTGVAALGAQLSLGRRDATRLYKNEVEFRKSILAYANQVRTAVSVLGSNDTDSLLAVKAQEPGAPPAEGSPA